MAKLFESKSTFQMHRGIVPKDEDIWRLLYLHTVIDHLYMAVGGREVTQMTPPSGLQNQVWLSSQRSTCGRFSVRGRGRVSLFFLWQGSVQVGVTPIWPDFQTWRLVRLRWWVQLPCVSPLVEQTTYMAHCSWAHWRRAFFADICHLAWTLEHFLAGGLEVGDESTTLTLSREGWL